MRPATYRARRACRSRRSCRSSWPRRTCRARCSGRMGRSCGASNMFLRVPRDHTSGSIQTEQPSNRTAPVSCFGGPRVATGDVRDPVHIRVEDVAQGVHPADQATTFAEQGFHSPLLQPNAEDSRALWPVSCRQHARQQNTPNRGGLSTNTHPSRCDAGAQRPDFLLR